MIKEQKLEKCLRKKKLKNKTLKNKPLEITHLLLLNPISGVLFFQIMSTSELFDILYIWLIANIHIFIFSLYLNS